MDAPVELPDKLFFKIGEVSRLVGVEPYVLRYWESEFRTIRPRKSRGGQRLYRRADVETLLRVKTLLRDEGFTVAGARKRLALERAGKERPEELAVDVEAAAGVAAERRAEAHEETIRALREDLLALREEIDRLAKR